MAYLRALLEVLEASASVVGVCCVNLVLAFCMFLCGHACVL